MHYYDIKEKNIKNPNKFTSAFRTEYGMPPTEYRKKILCIYPAWKITGKIIAPLEEAIRLQKEFVMFVGHELKTPVTVMKASLDMLEREGVHSKYLDYAV